MVSCPGRSGILVLANLTAFLPIHQMAASVYTAFCERAGYHREQFACYENKYSCMLQNLYIIVSLADRFNINSGVYVVIHIICLYIYNVHVYGHIPILTSLYMSSDIYLCLTNLTSICLQPSRRIMSGCKKNNSSGLVVVLWSLLKSDIFVCPVTTQLTAC